MTIITKNTPKGVFWSLEFTLFFQIIRDYFENEANPSLSSSSNPADRVDVDPVTGLKVIDCTKVFTFVVPVANAVGPKFAVNSTVFEAPSANCCRPDSTIPFTELVPTIAPVATFLSPITADKVVVAEMSPPCATSPSLTLAVTEVSMLLFLTVTAVEETFENCGTTGAK